MYLFEYSQDGKTWRRAKQSALAPTADRRDITCERLQDAYAMANFLSGKYLHIRIIFP